MAKPSKRNTTVRMSPEQRREVDAWATKRGLNRAEAIRQLVDLALTMNAKLPEIKCRGAEVQRMLDRTGP